MMLVSRLVSSRLDPFPRSFVRRHTRNRFVVVFLLRSSSSRITHSLPQSLPLSVPQPLWM
jgi:hypothetical protein